MKKKLVIYAAVIAATLFTSQAFSQVHFGVKGGINSNVISGDGDKTDAKVGVNAGIVAYTNLENPLFFQTGLLFSQKGGKEEGVKINLNYLEVPLNVGYSLPVGNFLKVSPFVGPYVGYALSGKMKLGGFDIDLFEDSMDFDDEDISIGLDDKAKRFDLGANLGVGVHFNDKIIISGQYSLGFLEVLPGAKNRGVSFGLTYLF